MKDFSFEGQRFPAKVVDVYDGDTIRIAFRFESRTVQYRARMAGYDSPEMKPPLSQPGRDLEVREARAARDALLAKIGSDRIVYAECGPFDKYGRILVTLFPVKAPTDSINAWMVDAGYGVPYDGGTKAIRRYN